MKVCGGSCSRPLAWVVQQIACQGGVALILAETYRADHLGLGPSHEGCHFLYSRQHTRYRNLTLLGPSRETGHSIDLPAIITLPMTLALL